MVAPATQASRDEGPSAALVGRARLAYFTPTHDHPTLADRKATFILTTAGLLTTVLLFFLTSIQSLIDHRPFLISVSFVGGLVLLGTLLLIAARWAFMGYVLSMPAMPPSLAYFRNIAGLERERYVESMLELDHNTALRAVLDYNYSVACQAAAKFRFVNRALRILKYAIPLWMVLLLIIAVWGK